MVVKPSSFLSGRGKTRKKFKGLLLSLVLPFLLMGCPTVQATTPTEIYNLIEQLESDYMSKRLEAYKALDRIGAEAVPALIEILQTQPSQSHEFWWTIQILAEIGPEAKDAIPILTRILDNRENLDSRTISDVALTLWEINPQLTKKIFPLLISILNNDEDPHVRRSVATYLGYHRKKITETETKILINSLINVFQNDPSSENKLMAAIVLGKVGKTQAEIILPILVKTLKKNSYKPSVIYYTAFAIAELINSKEKTLTNEVISSLVMAFKKRNELVRCSAAIVLININLAEDKTLIETLKNKKVLSCKLSKRYIIFNLGIGTDIRGRCLYNINERRTSRFIYFHRNIKICSYLDNYDLYKGLEDILQPSPLVLVNAWFHRNAQVRDIAFGTFWNVYGRATIIYSILIVLLLTFIKYRQFVFKVIQPIAYLQEENRLLKQPLIDVQSFLNRAGTQFEPKRKRYIIITSAPGKLNSYCPFPILLNVVNAPDKLDIERLIKKAKQLNSQTETHLSILIHKEPPSLKFRLELVQVRSDKLIIIPIPLAEIEQALRQDNQTLLSQYGDRYLPGADLFDTKTPVGETFSFFGRELLLRQLEENLQNCKNIGIFGLRKIGKTSVIRKLIYNCHHHPIVYIDLQKYGGENYSAKLFNSILEELAKLTKQNGNKTIFSRFSKGKIPQLSAQDLSTLKDSFTHKFLRLGKLLEKQGYQMPIFCFLDEMECILPRPTSSPAAAAEFNAVFGTLRALNQQHNRLSLLVADAHPDCNRINHWSQEGVRTNPLFSFFQEVFLPTFPDEDTRMMISDISQLMGREFDREVLERIHQQSGGYPLIARQLASLLHQKLGSNPISLTAAEPYLNNPFRYSGFLKDYFQNHLWEDLERRHFQSAIVILRSVALAREQQLAYETLLQQLQLRENQILDPILWLEAVGLIKRTADNGIISLGLPLLTCWLKMQFTPEQLNVSIV